MGLLLRRIQAMMLSKPANFSWVEDRIAASAIPNGAKHLTWLKKQGIDAILCLVEKPVNKKEAEELGLEYIHIPLNDHEPPEVENLIEAIQHIKRVTSAGKRILIHCAAGMGRTGTVLAAYFMAERGMSADEAIYHVRSLRPGSIEDGQEESLYRLEKLLRR